MQIYSKKPRRFLSKDEFIYVKKCVEAYEELIKAPENGTLIIVMPDGTKKEWLCMGISE